jgi:putative sterol carrier protein
MSTVRLVVAGTASGEVEHVWNLDQGESELTLNIDHKNYVRVLSGELTPPVAYMQGLLKSSGDMTLMLDLMAGSVNPDYSTWRDELRALGVA